jgi:DNA repair ATPase RecN
MQKTIAKKHRMQKEAEEFAAAQYNQNKLAEQRAEALAHENAQLKERLKPQEPKVEEVKVPKREDFDTDEAYEDARVDYRVDQKLKAQSAEAETRRREQQQQEVVQHAVARIERAMELVPDFKEVTESQDVAVPEFIASYMQESDMFAELGYHFAKHPDVLQKLTEFTANIRPGTQEYSKAVTRQLVEVGKIESTLSPFASPASKNGAEPSQKNGEKPSTETGSAPSKPRVQAPIIRPLNAGSAAQVGKAPEDMSTPETITAWQRKHGVKLTARKRH